MTLNRLSRFLLVLPVAAAVACGDDDDNDTVGGGEDASTSIGDERSSRAYRGHETDVDINNLVSVYPELIGTRLDDCQTCHRSGDVEHESMGNQTLNPCSYCHLIAYPDEAITSGAPGKMADTLNGYGADYLEAGRDKEALVAIASDDSDTDGHDNLTEIGAGRYPGDGDSKPGQPTADTVTLKKKQISELSAHSQFLLMNSHKQEFDEYAHYTGVTVKDLLDAAGVDLSGATGISVVAPDGFMKDFTVEEVEQTYPAGLYYANLDPGGFPDPAQGFVRYPEPDQIPGGIGDGDEIPGDQKMLIAYEREGMELDTSYLDTASGKLNGEGPFRLVVPQSTPGSPDRGSRFSPSGFDDEWDYDDNKDHNAGLCVRGVVAIRVNPMPSGVEEFDWKNGGFSLIDEGVIIVYGHGVTAGP
jgi:hypothetical protein